MHVSMSCMVLHVVSFFVSQVFECVSKLTMSDSDAEVRQASTMLLTLLLQGLRKDAFKVS